MSRGGRWRRSPSSRSAALVSPVPGRTRNSPLAAVLLVAFLVCQAAGCAPQSPARGNGIVVAVGSGLAGEAARVAAAYRDGRQIVVHVLSEGEDPFDLIRRGAVDVFIGCAAGTGALAIPAAVLPGPVLELDPQSLKPASVARFALVAAVDAFGPRPQLEPGEVLEIAAGRQPEGLPQVSLVRLAELGPATAGVEVGGVRPTPVNVTSGRYPLTVPLVAFWAGNLPSPLLRLWGLLGGLQRPEVARFVSWLAEDAGREALLGVGELVSMVAVGDVMLDRGVARRAAARGPDYPFDEVRAIVSGADLAVCNLESLPATSGEPVAGKGIWFQARPQAAAALCAAGFSLVSVANNHSLDYGRNAFEESLEILDGLALAYCGGGRDAAEARAPRVLECRGVRVAFLGYSEFADIYWTEERLTFEAGEGRPGVAALRRPYGAMGPEAVARANPHLAADIARARELAHVVVVSVHWGVEYSNETDLFQRLAGQLLVDAGADLVLGHHPHALQGLLASETALIAFSLGNFVFDQTRDVTTESVILRLELSPEGVFSWEAVPVRIVECQPLPVPGTADGEMLAAKLLRLSKDLRSATAR